MTAAPIEEFHYRIDWRARSAQPGHHRGSQQGGGAEFSRHAQLQDAPDPRRYDLRASLRDPFQRPLVRVYSQPGAIPVSCLADLSGSMGFGVPRKLDLLADFVASLGYSAYRTGDRFAFYGCAQTPLAAFTLAPTRRKAAGPVLAGRLRDFVPQADSAGGLLSAAGLLPARRGLVFLVSDFHLPLMLIEQLLAALAGHHVVPVVLWDAAEYAELPRFGLARLRDSETGRTRTLLLRPALRAAVRERFERRRRRLERLLRHAGPPLWLSGRFRADDITRYFFTR